jgi:hypothetical protein
MPWSRLMVSLPSHAPYTRSGSAWLFTRMSAPGWPQVAASPRRVVMELDHLDLPSTGRGSCRESRHVGDVRDLTTVRLSGAIDERTARRGRSRPAGRAVLTVVLATLVRAAEALALDPSG